MVCIPLAQGLDLSSLTDTLCCQSANHPLCPGRIGAAERCAGTLYWTRTCHAGRSTFSLPLELALVPLSHCCDGCYVWLGYRCSPSPAAGACADRFCPLSSSCSVAHGCRTCSGRYGTHRCPGALDDRTDGLAALAADGGI